MVNTLVRRAEQVAEAFVDEYPQTVVDVRIDIMLAAWLEDTRPGS